MKRDYKVIKCPNCKAEYLPAEIYLGNYFVGRPSNIIKDEAGKIQNFCGTDMDLKEQYICDYCNQEFTIFTDVVFKAQVHQTDDYVTKIEMPVLSLDET